MPNQANDVIGAAKAAKELHIHRSTLTRWVKAKKIEPFVRGTGATGELLFRRADIEALAKGRAA